MNAFLPKGEPAGCGRVNKPTFWSALPFVPASPAGADRMGPAPVPPAAEGKDARLNLYLLHSLKLSKHGGPNRRVMNNH